MSYSKMLLAMIGILSPILLTSQEDAIDIPFSDPSGSKTLEIDLFNGEIYIEGSSRQDISVTYKIEEGDNEDGEFKHHNEGREEKSSGLRKISGNNLDLKIGERNNEAYIKSHNWNKSIILTLEVPEGIDISIRNSMGRKVEIKNLTGNINVESGVGSIDMSGISGLVNASTSAGQIKIDFDAIPEQKSMIINNHTGDVDLTFPSTFKADLKMKTSWGDIYSDLDLETQPQKPEMIKDSEGEGFKYSIDNWTNAKLNGGGAEVTIKSQMGNIYLRKKEK